MEPIQKVLPLLAQIKYFIGPMPKQKKDKVIVCNEKVPNPEAIRYAWAANPEATLYNNEGLSASPFRTDTWTGITEK